jgi:DNA mismatch repair protein MutS
MAAIITGPNMAGKSTYMRQTAIIVLMAQIGSFVPAKSAHIGVCDRIFTRIGASDDLSGGQSTFMVEMSEVAEILSGATKRSFIILDEIGRGTSTYDGMSIARAVLEYVVKNIGARTMFATHYHELTVLSEQLRGVQNLSTAVRKRGDEITFLHRIIAGGADDSYGIEVAKLAGVSDEVVRRAKQILKSLEKGEEVKVRGGAKPREQASLADLGALELAERIRGTDLDSLTPVNALNLLYELKLMAQRLP